MLQAVIVRPLSAVSALVRFAEEPQMFAIEFNDGCPVHVSIFIQESCYLLQDLFSEIYIFFCFRYILVHLETGYLQQFGI